MRVVEIAFLWALSGPAPLLPPLHDEAAQRHAERAAEHWAADELAEASAELAAAYAIEPAPALLGAQGMVEQERGNCTRAIELFEAYLETEPNDRGSENARRRIVECGGVVPVDRPPAEEGGEPPPAPPPEVVEPAVEDGPRPPESPAAEPWSRDPVGGALVGTGAVILATGAGLLGGAFAVQSRAGNTNSHDMFVGQLQSAAAMEKAGYVLLGIGGALVVGGAVRWGIVARRSRQRARTGGPRMVAGVLHF